jgi:diguanylate cyclase (GGDEF)-like protein
MKAHRIPTIRSGLAWLVTACVVPASLTTVVLITHNYQHERAQRLRDSIATARAMMAAVDRDLAGAEAALRALATSPHLDSNDLAAFYGQALQVLQGQVANNLVLIDARGQQQINTLRPFGAVLPASGNPPQLQTIFDTGRAVITDVFVGPVTHHPVIAVGVPVVRDGKVRYSLNAGLFPERLSGVLTQQRLPADWIGTIYDSTGTIVARTHDMQRFVGTQAGADMVKHMAQASEGAFESDAVEGIAVISTFSRSAFSGWTVALGIPQAQLTGALWRSIVWLLLATAALLAASLGLAWLIGGRIARSIRELSAPALALGFGQAVSVRPLNLKEADEVGRALTRASQTLLQAQYQAQHDELTGLPNRALFNEIVNQQLALGERTGMLLAVLYVDLDGFKAVNDAYGHAIGDALLCAVASRLRAAIRGSDVAARLGGDEFAAVLMHVDTDAAAAVAVKLVESLSAAYPIDTQSIAISASIGVAESSPGCSSDSLLQRADAAMYDAKARGKRGYAVASSPPAQQTNQRASAATGRG